MRNPCIKCEYNSSKCVECIECEVLKYQKQIAELQEKLENEKSCRLIAQKTVTEKIEQLHRRNLQIADLKKKRIYHNFTKAENQTLWDALLESEKLWKKALNLANGGDNSYDKETCQIELDNIANIKDRLYSVNQ